MPRLIFLALFAFSALLPAAETQPNTDQHRAMLNTYCVTCHNAKLKTGGIAFDKLDLRTRRTTRRSGRKCLRKLRGHLMPPPGAPQPPQKDVDSFVAWMENTLDTHAKGPKAGHVPIERLNRTEYAAAVKALVGVDVKARTFCRRTSASTASTTLRLL